jgi:serine/threonine protein kinase
MWSIGCILADLLLNKIVFKCNNSRSVVTIAFMMLGSPTKHHCPYLMELPKYKELAPSMSYPVKQSLSKVYPKLTSVESDLLGKLLNLDYMERITAREALCHPYFSDMKH